MLSCSIRFSAPSFWMNGGLESRCVGRVCDADVAVRRTAPCMELSRVLQYISICTVLHGLIWPYVFIVCLYAQCKSDCDTGCI